jgi:hypothetical protein
MQGLFRAKKKKNKKIDKSKGILLREMDLENLFNRLDLSKESALSADVEYILYCFNENISFLNPNMFQVKPHMYPNVTTIYQEICSIISMKGRGCELLELMPYIDDYLEYFVNTYHMPYGLE